jgi:hypothetical protein
MKDLLVKEIAGSRATSNGLFFFLPPRFFAN